MYNKWTATDPPKQHENIKLRDKEAREGGGQSGVTSEAEEGTNAYILKEDVKYNNKSDFIAAQFL
jgi:hypothetical protein